MQSRDAVAVPPTAQVKSMSPKPPGNVKMSTVSRQPEAVWPAPAYAPTHEDIERSGATTIPDCRGWFRASLCKGRRARTGWS
ncbi:MAG TPA: hypothetical protein VGG42_07040 [Acidobacteriaceae bacterium]